MFTNRLLLKVKSAGPVFGMAPILILAIAVTLGFIHIQTDQVIVPPGLRLLDWLWRVFVCGC